MRKTKEIINVIFKFYSTQTYNVFDRGKVRDVTYVFDRGKAETPDRHTCTVA